MGEQKHTALLPCPFCGGSASMEQTESNRWSVGCDAADEPECMGYQSFTTFARRGEATKTWNTRSAATPSAQGVRSALAQLDSADAVRSELSELRNLARLAWNNWPDTEQSRRTLSDHESKDDASRVSWDRVVAAILSAAGPASWLNAPHNSGERLPSSDAADREAGHLISTGLLPDASPGNGAEKIEEALRDVLDHGLIYWNPNTKRGHVEKALMIARCEKLLATQAPDPARDSTDQFDDIMSRIAVFREHEPEEGETWESWYYASFDMLLSEIKEMRKAAVK